MAMTLADIAKIANVSKSTVSRALADSPLVKESTREHIKGIAAQYNYSPNTLAQAVAFQQSGILGFCLLKKKTPAFAHTFFGPVLDGAIQEAQDHGYHLILAANAENYSFDEPFIKDAIEGVILSSPDPKASIEEFKSRGIPQVLVNDIQYFDHTGFIMDDNYGGARMLTEHLIRDCGRKRIAIISDRFSHTSFLLRYLAFADTLHQNGLTPYENEAFRLDDFCRGIPLNNARIIDEYNLAEIPRFGTPIMVKNSKISSGYQAVKRLLATNDLPDAIFATTDSLAVGVLHGLQEAGIRVPEDIALVGYDDTEISYATSPAITTIHVDSPGIGRAAVRLLVQLIKDPERPSETIYIPNKLVIRGSSISNG